MARKRKSGFSIEAAKTLLRGANLRCTAARIAVVQTLGDHQTPLSPNEVADELAEFGFDKSTIYRSLTELDESGIVARLDLGDAVRRFELLPSGSEGRSEHPHFMCIDCGKVMCLSGFHIELVPDNPKQKPPGKMEEVLIKGHCDACRQASVKFGKSLAEAFLREQKTQQGFRWQTARLMEATLL